MVTKGPKMHDEKTVQRFIELRSQGWAFARIATELNVPNPPLLTGALRFRTRKTDPCDGFTITPRFFGKGMVKKR